MSSGTVNHVPLEVYSEDVNQFQVAQMGIPNATLLSSAEHTGNIGQAASRCPPEILESIFLYVRDSILDQYFDSDLPPPTSIAYGWLRITLTCRIWYDTAMNYRSLWTTIVCGYMSPRTISSFLARANGQLLKVFISDKSVPTDQEQTATFIHSYGLFTPPTIWHSRVFPSPLQSLASQSHFSLPRQSTIPHPRHASPILPPHPESAHDSQNPNTYLQDALAVILPHLSRITTLRYYSNNVPPGISDLQPSVLDAPRLEVLIVGTSERQAARSDDLPCLRRLLSSTPVLRAARLSHFVRWPVEHMDKLTNIQLEGQALTNEVFFSSLFESLKSCRSLQHLGICGLRVEEDENMCPDLEEPVQPRELRTLSIAHYAHRLVRQFLSNLILPESTNIIIEHDGACQDFALSLPLSAIHIPSLQHVTEINVQSDCDNSRCVFILRDSNQVPTLTAIGRSSSKNNTVIPLLGQTIPIHSIQRVSLASQSFVNGHSAAFWQYMFHFMTSLTDIYLYNILPNELIWVLLSDTRFITPDCDSDMFPNYCSDERHLGRVGLHSSQVYNGTLGGLRAAVQVIHQCEPMRRAYGMGTFEHVNEKRVTTIVRRLVESD
ncbi:hypothetical protein QCA50_015567 [Cerrena zonata]|uniref:F-box domain-containing protein n=1 Tax=Cerrena zonata TaxID=2478898 RepID=A0AAW0FXM1_9APHY